MGFRGAGGEDGEQVVTAAAALELFQAAALFQAPLSKTVRTAEALRAKVEEQDA